jgi:hypothetical protein
MYYFEYDRSGYLYKYVESYTEQDDGYYKDCVLCHATISGNTLRKLEDNGKFKSIVEYESPVQFEQRFEAGESWLSVVIKHEKDFCENKEEEEEDYDFEDNVERNYPEGSASYEISYTRSNKEEIEKWNKYPSVKRQFNLEDNVIYNLKFKINESLLNNWSNIVDF